ncbi:MAG: YbdD/YjiX family protein [Variovorax sp.]|jgi:uncharacterized short protein YbdD (DUF466 family)|nr:MAG: YbdD/YjiX family protein [Variovorax sp.]
MTVGSVVLGLPEAGRYLGRSLARSLRLMVGQPDYETYVSHMRLTHPDEAPMSYEMFFRERQEARYGGGRGRCC